MQPQLPTTPPATDPAPPEILELVRRVWGFHRLLPLQLEALQAIRAARNARLLPARCSSQRLKQWLLQSITLIGI